MQIRRKVSDHLCGILMSHFNSNLFSLTGLCVPGQKNVANTCTPCEIGTFSTTDDASVCTLCGLGNSTVTTGGSSPADCQCKYLRNSSKG